MELFLNILWALIALAALGVWRYRWMHDEHTRARKPWQQWTAFACALVFLFFAVSMSDDLHAEAILADDCTSGRHHSLAWNCSHTSDQPTAVPSLALGPAEMVGAPWPLLRMVTRVVETQMPVAGRYIQTANALRGPPLCFFWK